MGEPPRPTAAPCARVITGRDPDRPSELGRAIGSTGTLAAMAPTFIPSPSPGVDQRKLAQAARIEILGRLPLFAGAAKRHLRGIARVTRLEQFEADQDLLVEGQPSASALIVVAGRGVVRRNGRKIAEVGPGDIIGELGLLTDQPRSATVRTTGPMECLVLDRQGLQAAVMDHPALGWQLLGTVADRLSG